MKRTLLVVVCLTLTLPARADEEPVAPKPGSAAPPAERIWEGYLWLDDEDRVRVGWPVVAMGVMATPAHVVQVADRRSVAPFLSPTAQSYVFWNYRLEEDFETCLPKLPKVLVRVRGPVATTAGASRGVFGGGTQTMTSPRFVSVEFVSDAWLRAWAPVFREPWSPWRIRERPEGDAAAETRALAPRLLAALKAMRAAPGPTAEQKALAAERLPEAEVVQWFRHATEADILRWLHRMQEKHGLKLAGLDALGGVPPTGAELQRWFVAAADKQAFLAAVRKVWQGSLGALQLPHYESTAPGSVRWTTTRLDVVDAWTAETFSEHQRLTRETLIR